MSKINLEIIDTDKGFQILDIFLDCDGIISPNQLQEIQLPENIDYTKGILINGKGPIFLYAHLVHLCHPAAYAAVFDPRYGGVVVQRHKPESPLLGEIIPIEKITPYLKKKEPKKKVKIIKEPDVRIIAFLGPPHSGKSVLMNHLRLALRNNMPSEQFQNEFFIVKGCPDGEGDWSSESDSSIVKKIRNKNAFSDEFVKRVCEEIDSLTKTKKMLFVDCGGSA